jgi:transcriptional regulator with XRE-family HTH domain
MESKNELFLNAVDFLIDEGLAEDQSDIAKRAGLGPNLISRVRTGKVKNVSDDSIRALVSKFNINMDYFRGKSEYISRYDRSCANMEHELKEAQQLLDRDPLSNT